MRRFNVTASKLDTGSPDGPIVSRAFLAALILALGLPVASALTALGSDVPPDPRRPLSPSQAPHEESADADYLVRFRCPDAAPGTGVPAACPTYVLDREDILGSPLLVVDPLDPSRVAFHALHGGRGIQALPGTEPPTGRSRDDGVHQPHTVFASRDGGRGWEDMPYHAPDPLTSESAREIYGDDHAIALDTSGRIHLASLYSYREAAGPFTAPGPFRSAVALWKANGIERPMDYHVNLQILDPTSDPAAAIDSIHLVSVPDPDLVALVWRESIDGAPGPLVIHYSLASEGASWHAAAVAIERCSAITNPVALGARILVGCAANETGPWTMHAIDTRTWTAAPLTDAPITTQRAMLVPRSGDLVILVGSGLDEDSTATVQVSYSEGGARWSAVEEVATDLTRGDVATPMLDARVTAAAYNALSGNLHVVYLEHYDLGQGGEQGAGRPEFYKTFASLQAEGTFQAKIDLGVGTVNRAAFSPTLSGVGGGAYDDLHDGLVVWQDPVDGSFREFVAFGDYGFVRFAEVTEENFLSPIIPLSTSVPPIPLATAGSVPLLVGVPAGLLAGAMVARTLWARKAATAEAPSE